MRAWWGLLLLGVLVLSPMPNFGDDVIISGLQPDGVMRIDGLTPLGRCRIEWASSPADTWRSIPEVPNGAWVGTNSTLTTKVSTTGPPACYRVVALPPPESAVYAPSGTFEMGMAFYAEPIHTVTQSSFLISKYETSYAEWYATRTWATNHGYTFAHAGREGHAGIDGQPPSGPAATPVTMMSWRDVIVWCNAHSVRSGRVPVYTYGGQIVTNATETAACDGAFMDRSADGYRLPTESEWEYAARYRDGVSWTPPDYASGATGDINDLAATGAAGWHDGNSAGVTHPAGEKLFNALGAHDMSGNLWEWCWDWSATYDPGPLVDPSGPEGVHTARIRRSGTALSVRYYIQCSNRDALPPGEAFHDLGFRWVVRAE